MPGAKTQYGSNASSYSRLIPSTIRGEKDIPLFRALIRFVQALVREGPVVFAGRFRPSLEERDE